jgi:hypothetical protein
MLYTGSSIPVERRVLDPFSLFLATVMGTAVSNALKPEAVIGSAIGGIIGNRVDAGFLKGFNGAIGLLKGGDRDTRRELQLAIRRSIIMAQEELIQ